LVAGLDLRQFAGVLAHEFGHFTQGFAMRLTYIIRRINGWFARVAYERDAWDVWLERWAEEEEDWRMGLVLACARLGVWFSRLLLKLLMWGGHGIGCFLLRQMEYDADSYQIKVAGSEAFESVVKRLHVLGVTLQFSYHTMRLSWLQHRQLPESFPAFLMRQLQALPFEQQVQMEDTAGLGQTGLFDTHPANGDRIRRARQAGLPGIVELEGPASALFTQFDAVSRQVTKVHYSDDLGLDLRKVNFVG
jgi:Zn-dependent protease with chaperone function